MSVTNFWSDNDLDRYAGLYRRLQESRHDKLALVRKRLETGYYLSDQIAQAVAARMLGLRPRHGPSTA